MADGKVVYEARIDDGKINSDISSAESKIKKAAKGAEAQISDSATSASEDIKDTTDTTKNLDKELENTGKTASNFSLATAGMVTAIGAAAVSAGKIALDTAADFDTAMSQFAAATGTGEEELAEYEETLKSIYANNFGESFEDIATKMGLVTQQIGDLNQADLQTITEGIYTLEDTFGMDFNETLRGTDQLMKQFGITSEEALDLLGAAGQSGLNYTDELGDNISEYAGKFAQAGYSAEEYFQLLQNGSEGGAYNLDKVNDAINEVTTRLSDGTVEGALSIYSDKTQELFRAWQEGGASQKDVIDSIVEDINNCTNEQDALTMAATAFGTMGEDANLDFVKSLTSVGDEFDNVKGKMESIKEVKYDNLGSMLEGLGRTLELALLPLGEAIIPALSEALTALQPVIEAISEGLALAFGTLAEILTPLVETLLPPLLEIFNQLSEPLMTLVDGAISPLIEALPLLMEPLMELVETILPPIAEIIGILAEHLSGIVSKMLPILLELFGQIVEAILPLAETVLPVLVEAVENLAGPFSDLIEDILPVVLELFSNLIEPIAELAEELIPILIDIFDSLMPVIQSVMDLLSPLIELFLLLVSAILESVIPIIGTLAEMFSGILATAISLISPLIEGLMKILGGLIEFILGVFSGDWERAWNGVVGIMKGILNLIPSAVEGVINGAIDIINGLIGGINNITSIVGVTAIPKIKHVSLPRFHAGGIADFEGGEGLALLKSGEMVLTQKQQAELFAIANGAATPLSGKDVPIYANITLTGDVEVDGFTLGQVVLRNLDDAAAYTLRG